MRHVQISFLVPHSSTQYVFFGLRPSPLPPPPTLLFQVHSKYKIREEGHKKSPWFFLALGEKWCRADESIGGFLPFWLRLTDVGLRPWGTLLDWLPNVFRLKSAGRPERGEGRMVIVVHPLSSLPPHCKGLQGRCASYFNHANYKALYERIICHLEQTYK